MTKAINDQLLTKYLTNHDE